MTENNKENLTSPSSYHGKRQLSLGRRVYYFFGLPILKGLIFAMTITYKVKTIRGHKVIEDLISNKQTSAPCYWHEHSFVCLTLISKWLKNGFNGGFIVSPSVDGEVPAKIAHSWGAHVIRGSAVRTGAVAMMNIQKVMKQGVSIVTAADGPLGPKYEFKIGVALMSKIGSAPIIPISCASDRAWRLNRWDSFMIPKPFSQVVIAVGKPYHIPKKCSLIELEEHRHQIQDEMNNLMNEAKGYLLNDK